MISPDVILREAYSRGLSLGKIQLACIGGNFYLREDAADAFLALKGKSLVDGIELVIDDAFRSMSEQEALWKRHVSGQLPTPVAKPGYSNHQSGIALDIAVHRSKTSAVYKWLAENAPSLGWHNVGAHFAPSEYWHWEFTPHAKEKAP